ncbi:MAG: bifunctional diguanylate cyclase/phosphodiesterase [Pseudomonadota bacterium]|nr:bifunctional diguanylate cyclase/phosphodiesterase [Pseudomonadota bacterium]
MSVFRLTIQAGLVLAIVITGLIGAVLSFNTMGVYRELNIDFQRESLEEITGLEVHNQIKHAGAILSEVGLGIQKDPEVREALRGADPGPVTLALSTQFRQGAVTANVIRIVKLGLYDGALGYIGGATKVSSPDAAAYGWCPELISRAATRQGAERLQVLEGVCVHDGRPYYASLVPVGGLRPFGYLLLALDPVMTLEGVGPELGMPVRLVLSGGEVVYESPEWNSSPEMPLLVADYVLPDEKGDTALHILVAKPLSRLQERLDFTERRLIAVNVVVICLTVLIALLFLKKFIFVPLNRLRMQIQAGTLGETSPDQRLISFSALGDLYETLERQAITDPLTGLYNRALFEDRLKQFIAQGKRSGSKAAVFMMDMTRFKEVNDSLGHHVGDELLRQVASRIRGGLRESDTLARFGGDEFALILPGAGEEYTRRVSGKIRAALDPEFHVHGHVISATLSIGASLYPAHARDVSNLMRYADIALYHAKRQGEFFALYRQADGGNASAEHAPVEALRELIEQDGLRVAYQPLISASTGQVSYYEALIRCDHPELRRFSVEQAIELAERNDLIRPLSDRVFGLVCSDLARWRRFQPAIKVGVNVSMSDMQDTMLIGRLESQLQVHGVPAASIIIEVTESGVMQDVDRVQTNIKLLADAGFTVAIDDFGTGQASLARLRKLPVHCIKIDKSFVMEMETDTDAEKIVRATIDLGHDLGIRVVAEGVQSEPIYRQLSGLGCDTLQGFHISRPLPPERVIPWSVAAASRFAGEVRLKSSR